MAHSTDVGYRADIIARQLDHEGYKLSKDFMMDQVMIYDPQTRLSMKLETELFVHMGAAGVMQKFDFEHKQSDDYVHPGLTSRQLRDPVIRDAWHEIQIMIKLKGL